MSVERAVQPHDLLWGLSVAALPTDAPVWVSEAMGLDQPVVVRRAQVDTGWVAVGVRGRTRDQRYATTMRLADITRRVEPEQLIHAADPQDQRWPALRALQHVQPVMDSLGLPWGVAGSVGFALATGVSVLHEDSDLDVIVRTEHFLSRQTAADLVHALHGAECRVDVQLQTPLGAVALREWAGSARQVLLKAEDGARLVSDPWPLLEALA